MCVCVCVCAVLHSDRLCVGLARVGTDTQTVCHAPLNAMVTADIGGPLQSLVVTGKLHPLEEKMLHIACSTRTEKIGDKN